MPATPPAPVGQPTLTTVTDVSITFDAESAIAPVLVTWADSAGGQLVQRFSVPADSTFLALAAAVGSRKTRLYNVVLPLCGITPQSIT